MSQRSYNRHNRYYQNNYNNHNYYNRNQNYRQNHNPSINLPEKYLTLLKVTWPSPSVLSNEILSLKPIN